MSLDETYIISYIE